MSLDNNAILHHSVMSVELVAEDAEGVRSFDVGPSERHVSESLLCSFFSYSHTLSLVLTGRLLRI